MSSEYIDMLKLAAERATGQSRGLTAAAAIAETKIETELFSDYCSFDPVLVSVSAFRIEALLTSSRKNEFTEIDFKLLRDALLIRSADTTAPLSPSDLAISTIVFADAERKDVVLRLFDRFKSKDNFSLVSYSNYLIPVIGIDYLYDFKTSADVGESGGMGGPMRYYVRDFALERLYAHLGLKPHFSERSDDKAAYYSWAHVLTLDAKR